MSCSHNGQQRVDTMSSEHSPIDVVDTLLCRVEFVESLLEGPKEKQELVEHLDVSRSTVDRAAHELETTGLIEHHADGCQTTSAGKSAVTEFFGLIATVEQVVQADTSMQKDAPALGVCDAMIRRIEVVETLLEAPKDKRTLVEDLSISRSTVDRATRELESLGLIRYTADGYTPTSVCERTATHFFELTDAIGLRRQWEPFLQWVPDDEFDLDFHLLEDAELLLPEQGDPWAMVNRHVQLLKEADYSRVLLPLCGLHAYEAVHQKIIDEGGRCDSVVAPSVANTLQSNPDYAELTEDLVPTGRFTVSVYKDEIPYFVGILDDTVQIGVDENGEPRALLETDSPEIRDWAENVYTDYEQQAEKAI